MPGWKRFGLNPVKYQESAFGTVNFAKEWVICLVNKLPPTKIRRKVGSKIIKSLIFEFFSKRVTKISKDFKDRKVNYV